MSFSIIKADGAKQFIHRDNHTVLFHQALINLGALGMVSEMILEIVLTFQLQNQILVEDFEMAFAKLEKWGNTTYHSKCWRFPHTKKIIADLFS